MIPLIKPTISFSDVQDDITEILASGQLTSGKHVKAFESAVADYVGVRHAFATTSATTALHMSLIAAGIGQGDEVLVADFTFPASGNAIVQAGATPVLVDCCADDFLIDLHHAEGLITPNTKAIMPVATFGHPLDMDAIEAFADKHNLFIIEDAACSIGAQWKGRQSGSMKGTACFSFHPRKIITTGEGGMLLTDDDKIAEKIQVLRTHGGTLPENGKIGLVFEEFGFNYRMSEIQAALGLAQIQHLDDIIKKRRQAAALYDDFLQNVDGIRVPQTNENGTAVYQSYVILLDDRIERDRLVAAMREEEIETTLGTYAMHAQPAYRALEYKAGDLPNAYRAQQQSLTLPLLLDMPNNLVEHVCQTLKKLL